MMIEFTAQVTDDGNVSIPEWIRNQAKIKIGDVLKLAIVAKVIVDSKPPSKPRTKSKKTASS